MYEVVITITNHLNYLSRILPIRNIIWIVFHLKNEKMVKNDIKLSIAVVVNLEYKTSGYHSHKS